MSLEKLRKLQRFIFMGYILATPFYCVSQKLSIPMLTNNWKIYFYLLAMGTLVYEYFKFGFEVPRRVKWYLMTIFVWYALCLALGLVFYEYNETLTIATNPSQWIRKLTLACPWILHSFSELFFVKTWQFVKGVQEMLLNLWHLPLMICYICHVYKDDFDTALEDATKSAWILCIAMAIHSFFELAYIWFGAEWGKSYLLAVNPWIYKLPPEGYWWPPLLQYGAWQLRSMCVEPSFCSIIIHMTLPLLVLSFTKFKSNAKKIAFVLLWAFCGAMVLATKSRACNAIWWLMHSMMFASVFFIRKWNYAKSILTVCLVTALVTFDLVGTGLTDHTPNNPLKVSEWLSRLQPQSQLHKSSTYLRDNFLNIAERDARSNNTRYGLNAASFAVFKEHPLFGVGLNLQAKYLLDHIPDWAKDNPEILGWMHLPTHDGATTTYAIATNLYLSLLNAGGILALLLTLLPLFYCGYFCFLNFKTLVRSETAICLASQILLCCVGWFGGGSYDLTIYVAIPTALLYLWNKETIHGKRAMLN